MWQYTYSDELYHHGIKGQKWGVRRYQNPDGSLTPEGIKRAKSYQKYINKMANKSRSREDLLKERTIPAGTKMYRTSVDKNESLNGSTYVSYTDVDRNHYKGGWIRQTNKSGRAYEHEFTLNEDLRIPSREKQTEVINKVVNSNKKYIRESLQSWFDQAYPENSWGRIELDSYYDGGSKKIVDDMVKEWKNRTPESAAFTVCQSLGLAPNVKKAIITDLKKQGYNAMVDEASVGGRNDFPKEGYDPLVIFDSSVLKKESTKEISRSEENRSHNKDIKWGSRARRSYGQWSAI